MPTLDLSKVQIGNTNERKPQSVVLQDVTESVSLTPTSSQLLHDMNEKLKMLGEENEDLRQKVQSLEKMVKGSGFSKSLTLQQHTASNSTASGETTQYKRQIAYLEKKLMEVQIENFEMKNLSDRTSEKAKNTAKYNLKMRKFMNEAIH